MKRLIGLLAVLLLALPMAASANNHNGKGGQPTYQVSGGGQVIASSDAEGPGDTIAFVAQLVGEEIGQTDDDEPIHAARGQLQVVDRTDGRGRDQQLFHGRVTCIVPLNGNVARFGGNGSDPRDRNGDGPIEFVVDVTDNSDQGTDLVSFQRLGPDSGDPASPCEAESESDFNEATLARGNVKIHDRR